MGLDREKGGTREVERDLRGALVKQMRPAAAGRLILASSCGEADPPLGNLLGSVLRICSRPDCAYVPLDSLLQNYRTDPQSCFNADCTLRPDLFQSRHSSRPKRQ